MTAPLRTFVGILLCQATLLHAESIESEPFAKTPMGAISFSPTLFTQLGPTETRIDYMHEIALWHKDKRLYHSSFACGAVLIGDLDGDKLSDVFVTGGPRANKLYLNAGSLTFVDVTAGVPEVVGADSTGRDLWAGGGAMIDIDNDGDLDVYVCYYDAPNQLFLNLLKETGKLGFVESAASFGLDLTDASLVPAFADYDGDGDLDLYLLTHQLHRIGGRPGSAIPLAKDSSERTGLRVDGDLGRYYEVDEQDDRGRWLYKEKGRPDYLMRNDGGTFREVAAAAGITKKANIGNSATWWDFNDDGLVDLHVGNDFLDPDYLYRNNGNGTFTDVLSEVFPQSTWFTMGSAVTDANGDGRPDFVVADMFPRTHYKQKASMASMSALSGRLAKVPGARQIMRNALFVNTGTAKFQEAAYLAGVGQTDWTWAIKSGDFDQDGRDDLFFTNGAARVFNHSDLPVLDHDRLVGKSHWDHYEDQPEKREQNLAFRNIGELSYEDVSRDWGLDHIGMTHTAAQGDLDNDGDLDLITCSLNDPIFVYRNDGATGNAIRIQLRGTKSNRFGIGTTVLATINGRNQVRQLQSTKGFLDSDEPLLHFGLGEAETVDELTLRWPSGIEQRFENLAANQLYTITEAPSPRRSKASPPKTWFTKSDFLGGHPRRETPFNDFEAQPLLPFKLSQVGPAIAWGDMDRDGLEDLWIGGSAEHSGIFFYNKTRVSSSPVMEDWIQPILRTHAEREDMGAVFFDADADGDLDLYVASGSVEHPAGSQSLRDRLYLNKGWGQFTDGSDRLPDLRENSSSVAAADFDRDGDVDLFVGTRSIIGEYPKPADSHLLVNDGTGTFTDGTLKLASGLLGTGLVTGAVWTDVDNDDWIDLVVAHEWGPIKVFRNREGRLESPSPNSSQDVLGWWNAVSAADLDNDGDMDLVATNLGMNSQYQASISSPELIFYGDLDGTGKSHIVEANFENGVCYPRRGLSCSSQAMPFVKQHMQTYHDFASASLSQIYPIERLKESTLVKANELRSGVFINDGEGNFQFSPLPRITQIAPGFGVVLRDFDLDGYTDCYVAQNHFSPQEETGPMRGGLSQLLRRNPASNSGEDLFVPIPPDQSGLLVDGDAKSVTAIDLNRDQRLDLVIGINDAAPAVYLNRAGDGTRAQMIRLKGLAGNPNAVGARVTVKIAGMPLQTAEVSQGSGFLSSSTNQFIFAKPANFAGEMNLVIRWPDGSSEERSVAVTGEPMIIAQAPVEPEQIEVSQAE